MAPIGLLEEMDESVRVAHVKKLAPNLLQILNTVGVPELVQANLAKATFTTIANSQVFAFTGEGVLELCKRLGLDSAASLLNLGIVASVVLAWQNCKAIQTVEIQSNAEKKRLGITNTMKPSEYTTLKQQFDVAHGKLPPAELPGAAIV